MRRDERRDEAIAGTSPLAADALRQLVESELSMKARVGHVALLLVSLLVTIGIVSLWWTEPRLPARTHVAFGVMTFIGLSWSAFAIRVLTGRRILFARHRVMAGQMAVTFTSVFVIGALTLGYVMSSTAAYLAAVLGAVMLAAAAFILMRAHRALTRLDQRRQTLERQTRTTA
jgi:hypothetical protein